jgi:hypothetical protein
MGGTYSSAQPIVPSDTTRVNCRAIVVGVAGNLVITNGPIGAPTGPTVIAVVAGIFPIELNEGLVNAATTATGLVGLA